MFDSSNLRQVDKYVTNLKRIAKYIGAEYKQGSDIRLTIENETQLQIPPVPAEPIIVQPATEMTTSSQELIFKGQIDQCIKWEAMLKDNIQKVYSLILGQCTKLLKAKLKQSNDCAWMSSGFDVLALIKLIKCIVFKFDNQKFLPVSLHQAKQSLYNLCQGTMSNTEYLEKFNKNYVDITTSSYDGKILSPHHTMARSLMQ